MRELQNIHKFRSDFINLIDVTNDGNNEVVLVNYYNDESRMSELKAYDVINNRVIWSHRPSLNVDYSHNSDLISNDMSVRYMKLVNMNKETNQVLFTVSDSFFFPSLLEEIEISTGEITRSYLHTGRVRALDFLDFDGDGTLEILFVGTNNTYEQAIAGLMKYENLNGQSPSLGRHRAQNIEIAEHIFYVRLPKTYLSQHLNLRTNISEARNIGIGFVDNLSFRIGVLDFHENSERYNRLKIHLLFYFDENLRPSGIGTTSELNMIKNELIEAGVIEGRFTPEYINELMDEISYYIDGEWVRWGDVRE